MIELSIALSDGFHVNLLPEYLIIFYYLVLSFFFSLGLSFWVWFEGLFDIFFESIERIVMFGGFNQALEFDPIAFLDSFFELLILLVEIVQVTSFLIKKYFFLLDQPLDI